MIVLGLTGSVGMGKSTVATMLRRHGVPVHDSDAAAHALLAPGGAAAAAVARAFPDAAPGGIVDRAALGREVFADRCRLRALERIVHPLVRRHADAFLRRHAGSRTPLVVLDVPLLYETGGERRVDAVVVVTAPGFLQERRVLLRPGMDRARLAAVRAAQMPDHEKRRRADYVVHTGLGRAHALRCLRRILGDARRRARENGGGDA